MHPNPGLMAGTAYFRPFKSETPWSCRTLLWVASIKLAPLQWCSLYILGSLRNHEHAFRVPVVTILLLAQFLAWQDAVLPAQHGNLWISLRVVFQARAFSCLFTSLLLGSVAKTIWVTACLALVLGKHCGTRARPTYLVINALMQHAAQGNKCRQVIGET